MAKVQNHIAPLTYITMLQHFSSYVIFSKRSETTLYFDMYTEDSADREGKSKKLFRRLRQLVFQRKIKLDQKFATTQRKVRGSVLRSSKYDQ